MSVEGELKLLNVSKELKDKIGELNDHFYEGDDTTGLSILNELLLILFTAPNEQKV
jgi:hypothetical protein